MITCLLFSTYRWKSGHLLQQSRFWSSPVIFVQSKFRLHIRGVRRPLTIHNSIRSIEIRFLIYIFPFHESSTKKKAPVIFLMLKFVSDQQRAHTHWLYQVTFFPEELKQLWWQWLHTCVYMKNIKYYIYKSMLYASLLCVSLKNDFIKEALHAFLWFRFLNISAHRKRGKKWNCYGRTILTSARLYFARQADSFVLSIFELTSVQTIVYCVTSGQYTF